MTIGGGNSAIKRAAMASAVAALLSGCVQYAPRPVEPSAVLLQPVTSDMAAIRAEVGRIAPGGTFDERRWDAVSLLAAALLANRYIAAARAAVASADAGARAARTSPGPTLTLASEYAGAAPEASPWLFGAGLDIPLDNGGRRRTRIDAARLQVAVARYDYAEAVWTVRMAIRQALAARFVAERQVAALTPALALRDRQFAAMSRRVDAGEASRAELERVRADRADTARRRAESQAQIAASTTAIAAATGLPVAAFAGMTFVWPDFDIPGAAPAPGDDARIAALLSRADVLKAIATYDGSENDLRGEIAKQFPAITLSPGFTWERGLVKLPFNLGLALPPLDLNRRAIVSAEARRAEAGKRLEATVYGAGAAFEAARLEAQAARVALAAVRGGELVTARRLAKVGDREIEAGAIDRTDWAEAQAGLATARLSEIDALARVHAADAALEDAARRPLLGPELAIGIGSMRP